MTLAIALLDTGAMEMKTYFHAETYFHCNSPTLESTHISFKS